MLLNVSPKNSVFASSADMSQPSCDTASAVSRAAIGSLSTSTPSQSKITKRGESCCMGPNDVTIPGSAAHGFRSSSARACQILEAAVYSGPRNARIS